MTRCAPYEPWQLYLHALRVGDDRLAALLAARLRVTSALRLSASSGASDPLVERVVRTLRERVGASD